MTKAMLLPLLTVLATGCLQKKAKPNPSPSNLPATPGEKASAFGYVPLDGLAVQEQADTPSCKVDTAGRTIMLPSAPLLDALPDISVRFAVASLQADGSLAFGPAKITTEGGVYRAVLDYVNVEALPEQFFIRKVLKSASGPSAAVGATYKLTDADTLLYYEVQTLGDYTSKTDTARVARWKADAYEQVTIPVYVGIGMRVSADIRSLKGGIALTSLGAIGADAEANALSGTLTLQTIGVTGKAIATGLPLPNKLDQTTVENSILALGSSRAFIYSGGGEVTTTPRVVGIYSPIGTDPRLISGIYSALARERPILYRRCARKAA